MISGERLQEIALRYGVSKKSLIRWNKLDPKRPRIRAGQKLKVYTRHPESKRHKIVHVVEKGETWSKIADLHGVDRNHLRKRWNAKAAKKKYLKVGQRLTVWVDVVPEESETALDVIKGAKSSETSLPLVAIPGRSQSVGRPNRGRLLRGVRMPENEALYHLRKPEEAWGSSHTLHHLQLAIAHWRQDSGYGNELLIGAISKKGGGRLRPHSSHQSGRDVDIRLPLARNVPKGTRPMSASQVDWRAAWILVKSLADTGEVEYIFLERGRQKYLYRAAKKAGASASELERLIDYPKRSKRSRALVRHERGHVAHIHVRFTCSDKENRCESY